MFETQKSGNKTNSGEIGIIIRTHASPKEDRTNFPEEEASPLQIIYGKFSQLGKTSNSVKRDK